MGFYVTPDSAQKRISSIAGKLRNFNSSQSDYTQSGYTNNYNIIINNIKNLLLQRYGAAKDYERDFLNQFCSEFHSMEDFNNDKVIVGILQELQKFASGSGLRHSIVVDINKDLKDNMITDNSQNKDDNSIKNTSTKAQIKQQFIQYAKEQASYAEKDISNDKEARQAIKETMLNLVNNVFSTGGHTSGHGRINGKAGISAVNNPEILLTEFITDRMYEIIQAYYYKNLGMKKNKRASWVKKTNNSISLISNGYFEALAETMQDVQKMKGLKKLASLKGNEVAFYTGDEIKKLFQDASVGNHTKFTTYENKFKELLKKHMGDFFDGRTSLKDWTISVNKMIDTNPYQFYQRLNADKGVPGIIGEIAGDYIFKQAGIKVNVDLIGSENGGTDLIIRAASANIGVQVKNTTIDLDKDNIVNFTSGEFSTNSKSAFINWSIDDITNVLSGQGQPFPIEFEDITDVGIMNSFNVLTHRQHEEANPPYGKWVEEAGINNKFISTRNLIEQTYADVQRILLVTASGLMHLQDNAERLRAIGNNIGSIDVSTIYISANKKIISAAQILEKIIQNLDSIIKNQDYNVQIGVTLDTKKASEEFALRKSNMKNLLANKNIPDDKREQLEKNIDSLEKGEILTSSSGTIIQYYNSNNMSQNMYKKLARNTITSSYTFWKTEKTPVE